MLSRIRLFAFVTLILVSNVPRAALPEYILSAEPSRAGGTNLQIAVFSDQGKKRSFALGCVELAKRWAGVTQRQVAPVKWNDEVQAANVVADIDCKDLVERGGKKVEGSTKKYQSKGEPGSFVITYRDGTKHLHFVDNVEWFKAVAGPVATVSPNELRALVTDRGPDFLSKVAAPAKQPQPQPSPNPAPGPTRPASFTSYWSGSYFFIDAKNPASNALFCTYQFTFAYDDFGTRKQRTESGSFSLSAGFSGNAVKFTGAWVNPAKVGEPTIQCK